MSTAAEAQLPANASILDEATIAIRYIIIPDARWTGVAGHRRLNLELVHRQIETSPEAAAHVRPFATFYMDVTLPFTTRQQLPIVAIAGNVPDRSDIASVGPLPVEIEIDEFTTIWEDGNYATVPAARVTAEFTDTVSLFDSGHMLYAPAFVMHAPPGPYGTRLISALTGLVGFPGGMYQKELDELRSRIRFRLFDDAEGVDLRTFVNNRLAYLSDEQAAGTIFHDLIRPVLKTAGWTDNQRLQARRDLANLAWSSFQSVAVEAVGGRHYYDIARICHAAKTRATSSHPSELALAALAQNILDVENQDEHEVADSLSQAIVTDAYILTVHPKLTLRFSRSARSFSKMLDLAGGCPYFLLTNVVLAYNEHLLERSAELAVIIKEHMRKSRWQASARNDLNARIQMFENETMYVLPNIFRYPTERVIFDEIVKQRGLNQRAFGIERFTSRMYEIRKDFVDLAEREETKRTNRLLLALAILQVSGLFLTLLTLNDLEGWKPAIWISFIGTLVLAGGIAARALVQATRRAFASFRRTLAGR
jgi:hypothetical protein